MYRKLRKTFRLYLFTPCFSNQPMARGGEQSRAVYPISSLTPYQNRWDLFNINFYFTEKLCILWKFLRDFIEPVISHESLCALYMRRRFFLPCAYRHEVKYCWVLCVRYTISCYISNYKFLVHYRTKRRFLSASKLKAFTKSVGFFRCIITTILLLYKYHQSSSILYYMILRALNSCCPNMLPKGRS